MSKVTYELTKYIDGVPETGIDISDNQMELIHAALNEYQETGVYDEDSPYYDEQDASDFSELQNMIGSI
jgi:hypothetical protein